MSLPPTPFASLVPASIESDNYNTAAGAAVRRTTTTTTRSGGRSENFNLVLVGEFRILEVPAISPDDEYNFQIETRIEYCLFGYKDLRDYFVETVNEVTRITFLWCIKSLFVSK